MNIHLRMRPELLQIDSAFESSGCARNPQIHRRLLSVRTFHQEYPRPKSIVNPRARPRPPTKVLLDQQIPHNLRFSRHSFPYPEKKFPARIRLDDEPYSSRIERFGAFIFKNHTLPLQKICTNSQIHLVKSSYKKRTNSAEISLTLEFLFRILASVSLGGNSWRSKNSSHLNRREVRPRATIRPSGLISFDAASVETFGLDSASYAVLFFDKTRKIVGVQITVNEKDDGALKLSRRRRSVSLKAPQFFDLYGLSFDEAQRFDVGRDPSSKMLTISLKNIKRRRGRRPKKAEISGLPQTVPT